MCLTTAIKANYSQAQNNSTRNNYDDDDDNNNNNKKKKKKKKKKNVNREMRSDAVNWIEISQDRTQQCTFVLAMCAVLSVLRYKVLIEVPAFVFLFM
jgi:hypothetical protein